MILQIIVLILMVYVMCNAISKPQKNREIIIDRENTKELNNLNRLRQISLSKPLTEKSRPSSFDEVIGQEKGIKALKAALCGPNPQHVIIFTDHQGLERRQQLDWCWRRLENPNYRHLQKSQNLLS